MANKNSRFDFSGDLAWLPWLGVAIATLVLAIWGIASLAQQNPALVAGPTTLASAPTPSPQVTITLTAFQPSSAGPTLKTLPNLKGRALKVGTDPTYPPFESLNEKQEIVGFDVDLVTEICKRINCNATFVASDLDRLLDGVQNRTFDLSVSAWIISEERAKIVDWGLPYMPNPQILLVRAEENRIKEPEDFKNGNWSIAVQSSTTSATIARKLVNDPTKQIKEFPELTLAVQALISKQADAVVIDIYSAIDPLDENRGKLKVTGKPFGDAFLGFAFRKGDLELREAFNAGLKAIYEDGTWSKLCTKAWKDIALKPDCTGKTLPFSK